jgi:hypothetical protein
MKLTAKRTAQFAADRTADRTVERRQARRSALLLGVFAVALYASFILYALRHGRT